MTKYTSYYQIPYPELTEPPHGPAQLQAIADRIELLLKNGFTTPSGNLAVGDYASATQRALLTARKHTSTADQLLSWLALSDDYTYLNFCKNNVEINRLMVGADGSVAAFFGGVVRPHPFAMWATTVTVPLTAVVVSGLPVTFPVNRFTQPPVVTCTTNGNSPHYNFAAGMNSATATGATISARNLDNVATTTNVVVNVLAVQMTPSSGPGLREAPEHTHLVTCHTDGCENADTEISLLVEPESDSGVVCGPCGQPVEDVSPV